MEILELDMSIMDIERIRSNLVYREFSKIFKKITKEQCPLMASQYDLVRIIYKYEPAPQKLITEKIGGDRTTVTRRTQILIKHGYVAHHRTSNDKRCVTFTTTAKGRALVEKFADEFLETNRQLIKLVGIKPIKPSK